MTHEAMRGRVRCSVQCVWSCAVVLMLWTACSGDDSPAHDNARTDAAPEQSDATPASGPTDAGSSSSTGSATAKCKRDSLQATIDQYFKALAAHEPGMVSMTASVKYTENGKMVDVGQGIWKTAGELKFKRSVIDTETCNTVTESVLGDDGTDRVMGLRLRSDAGKISEIEAIIIHPGDYPFGPNPQALIDSKSDDWETPLAPDQRASRDDLTLLVDRYFKLFPAGACGFMQGCQRLENGFAPPGYDCDDLLSCDMTKDVNAIDGSMKPRLRVIDVDTSVAVGFAIFAGAYTDFHMFKVRDGQVVGVHATLAAASGSGWD